MKISFIAENDFANVLTEYSYCLNKHSEDIEAKSICFRSHPFNYNIQHDYDLEDNPNDKLKAKQWIEDSDIIIFGEEGHPLENKYRTIREFDTLLSLDLINSNKKLCIWHPGTHYRENYNFYNNHSLRDKIYKHFYALDLYRLSPKDNNDWPLNTYQYYDFDYGLFINNFKDKLNKKPWTILHIPSNPSRKGTQEICNTISNLDLDPNKFQFKIETKLPYSKVIQEKDNSVFYIDQYNIEGCYGVSAIESLFRSNFTFSVLFNAVEALHKLTGEYKTPIVPLEYPNNLYSNLKEYIVNISEQELLEYMGGIGQWLEKQYKPSNIVKFFKNILNE